MEESFTDNSEGHLMMARPRSGIYCFKSIFLVARNKSHDPIYLKMMLENFIQVNDKDEKMGGWDEHIVLFLTKYTI